MRRYLDFLFITNGRVVIEEKFFRDTDLDGHIFDAPTRKKGTQNGFLDRVFYSHASSIDFIHQGQCLNGTGPTQYPDHIPLCYNLTHICLSVQIYSFSITHIFITAYSYTLCSYQVTCLMYRSRVLLTFMSHISHVLFPISST